MRSAPRKLIRYLPVLWNFFLKLRFHFHQMNILPYSRNFFRVFINTPERYEIITSRKKSGCWMEQRFCMVVRLNCAIHLNMTFHRKRTSAIEDFPWMKFFIILHYLSRLCGYTYFLERVIRGQQQYFLSNI